MSRTTSPVCKTVEPIVTAAGPHRSQRRMLVRVVLGALILSAILSVTNCDLAGIGIERRIELFMREINKADRSGVKQHLDRGADDYSGADAASWETPFPVADRPYTIDSLGVSGSIATGNISSDGPQYDDNAIAFEMRKRDNDWFIRSITIGVTSIFN